MNERPLRLLLVLLGLIQLAAGCWMTFATSSFAKRVAPYGAVDRHDLRDFATFYLALGVALLGASIRPTWRVPILGLATLEYGLHTINHAIDVNHAHPAWVGPADLAALAAATALFACLAWAARTRGASSVADQRKRGRATGHRG